MKRVPEHGHGKDEGLLEEGAGRPDEELDDVVAAVHEVDRAHGLEGALDADEEELLEARGRDEDEHRYEVEELAHEGELDLGQGIVGLRGPEADLQREELARRREGRVDDREEEAHDEADHRLADDEEGVGHAVVAGMA